MLLLLGLSHYKTIMNFKLKTKNKRGFTLIEMLLYVAIFTIFVGSLFSFLTMMTSSRLNNQYLLEVNNQGNQAIRVITQTIRNANSINSPGISGSASSLSLETVNSATNPTVFSSSGGVLYITEGSGSPIALTNDKVSISNLLFLNLSKVNTPGSIQVRFTLSTNSNSVIKTIDFYGGGTLKK